MKSVTRKTLKSIVTGEQREGFCESCCSPTQKEFYMDGERKRVRMICPVCGRQGRLIVKTYSVQPPQPPTCMKPGCIWRFFLRVIYTSLLSTYHSKRVTYATNNRHKIIQEKYRTGEPSPQNIKDSIKAIIGLKLRR